MKIKVKISGPKVHDVGYRSLLLEAAEDERLKGFMASNFKTEGVQVVQILLEGDEAQIMYLRGVLESERPAKAEVSAIEFGDYDGPVEPIGRYSKRFTQAQLRKGVAILARMDEKLGRMLKKWDEQKARSPVSEGGQDFG
jgi:acylphosphatase